ncbi:MAG: REP-associated tyrosine transposase [Prosthecobacter sp.]|uniref:REP-associated tyrosine transposase n=1 Tax=Prosthecobacter sp. TaxID=1965333 RepID=UPI0038FE7DEE
MALLTDHSGWTDRGYLPHYDKPGLVQAVTFRLADSLPKSKRSEWEHLLQITDDAEERNRQIECYLDQGAGSCVLRQAECAEIVQNALLHFHSQRYRLIAWCVMPNHVHVLFKTFAGHPLGKIIHSWKTFTAREINKFLRRVGPLWQEDYFDTFMRDDDHQWAEKEYIEGNPVKAKLVTRASDWPWSSAARSASMA